MRVGMGFAAALATGALLAGSQAAVAGDVSASVMTTAQARKAYLKAVCPVDDAIAALTGATSKPDAIWASVQPLVQQLADAQIREADRLTNQQRPWPTQIRESIPAIAELQLTQAGANTVLAGATSLEEYNALIEELGKGLSAPLKAHLKSFKKAKVVIHRRLGLPKTGGC